jgi:hypothetical protein
MQPDTQRVYDQIAANLAADESYQADKAFIESKQVTVVKKGQGGAPDTQEVQNLKVASLTEMSDSQKTGTLKPETLEHMLRHFSGSTTIGSKFDPNLAESDKATLLAETEKETVKQVAAQIRLLESQGKTAEDLGRVPADPSKTIERDAGKPIGTDTLIEKGEGREFGKIVRDAGHQFNERDINYKLVNDADIQTTSKYNFMATRFGGKATNLVGVAAIFPGDPGKPFARPFMPPAVQEELNQYWDTHAFQATRKEVEAAVADMETKILAKEDLALPRRTQVQEMVKGAKAKLTQLDSPASGKGAVAAQEDREARGGEAQVGR